MISIKMSITSIFVMILITSIFVHAFGSNLLDKDKSSRFVSHSQLIYILATIFGQLAYSIVSRISGGIIILPTFENNSISQEIHQRCISSPFGFQNTLISLSLSSILAGLISLTLSFLKIGAFLKSIPLTIIVCAMTKSGIELFLHGCSLYFRKDCLVPSFFYIFLSLIITLVGMYIFKRFKDPLYFIVYMLAIILIVNLVCKFINKDVFFGQNLMIAKNTSKLSFASFYSDMKQSSISLKLVLSNWKCILEMGLLPLIPFSINLPAYASTISTSFDFNSELLALGCSNLFSSLAFYPVYFNCSGSVMFHISGANSKIYSILAGISCISLFWLFNFIISLIPVFVVSMITQFVGISVILQYFNIIYNSSYVDQFILISSILLYLFRIFNIFFIILYILICEYLHMLIYTLNISIFFSGSSTKLVCNISLDCASNLSARPTLVLLAGNSLNFANFPQLLDLAQQSASLNPNRIVIDLQQCQYVDMTANFELKKLIKEMAHNNIPCYIVGSPHNSYEWLYRTNKL